MSSLQVKGMNVSATAGRGHVRKISMKASRKVSQGKFIVIVKTVQDSFRGANLDSFDGDKKVAVLIIRTRQKVRAVLSTIKQVLDPQPPQARRQSRFGRHGHERPATTVRVRHGYRFA